MSRPLVHLLRGPALLVSGTCALVLTALIAAAAVASQPLFALAPLGLVTAAALSNRFPAAAVLSVFALTAFNGTITALTPFPVGLAVDCVLAGLWAGTVWRLATTHRERPVWFWPGVAGVAGYLGLTAFEIVTAESLTIGLESFRITAWYMLAVLLIGYAGWDRQTYGRVARGVVAVAALTGAYAVMRWIIGPAASERTLAVKSADIYNFVQGDLRVFGSFTSGHELGAWSAIAVPFCFAFALGTPGRWRLVAVLAAVLCTLGMLASQVRIGLVAAIVGVVVAIVLFQGARAFPTVRIHATAAALLLVPVVGLGAFALTVGGSAGGGSRYELILTPGRDEAYQTRVTKWRTALEDIDRHPFGGGLGSAGQVNREKGRFANIGSIGVDNSYLKIALEQGFVVMVLFAAGLLLLLAGLARRAWATSDPARATLGIGAAATLASYLTLLTSALYIEGLTAMAAWTVVGLGVAQFAALEAGRAPAAAPAEPAPRARPTSLRAGAQ